MSTLPPPVLRPRPQYYVYAVVDMSTVTPDSPNPELVEVKQTRKEGRDLITYHPEADNLRVRRGRLTLYES